jgi:hypothetical protein
MTFVQVAEWNPPNKNKRGSENLVLPPRVISEVQAIKLLASLTYPLKIIKGQSIPASYHDLRPTPHRHPTLRQAQRVLRVWVAPNAEAPRAAA